MLDVLMYLLQHHVGEEKNIPDDEEQLIDHLEESGFEFEAIDKALTWLDELASIQKNISKSSLKHTQSTRLYSKNEINKIELKAQSFLIFLEQMQVVTPVTREMILDRLMALELPKVDLPVTKWVTLMVLFNQPDAKTSFANIEHLIMAEAPIRSH